MAMNKKEKAEFESLQKDLEFNVQLIKTLGNLVGEKIQPDIPHPEAGELGFRLTKGWLYNLHTGSVDKVCSSCISHSYGRDDKTTTQQPKNLYSTKELAMKAMRYEKVQKFIKELVALDKRIENLEG